MSVKNYEKSPIREAIFDIRFKYSEQPDLTLFEQAYEKIRAEYPKREVTNFQSVQFEIKAGETPKLNANGGATGLRLTSSDATKIVQFRVDGFTFSQLKPYNNWDDFINEGKRLLTIYLDNLRPEYAERIALRYINGIEIPESIFKLEDYFLTSPKIGDDIPQRLINFFSRLMIKDDFSDSIGIINQTVEENGKVDSTTILFDIDVFQSNLKIRTLPDGLQQILESLKLFRTKIFEGSLTEKAKGLIS